MFSVEVQGVDPLIAKLDRLTKQIEVAEEEMPRELVTWQREDMHRKFPNMQAGQAGDETTALTSIWPRSRLIKPREKQPRLTGGPRLKKAPRVALPGSGRVHSTRPVLRPELYDRLVARMTELIGKAMQWP